MARLQTRSRLSGIQALRGIAAVSVVLDHAARHLDKGFGAPKLAAIFLPGHAGVDLFFVISGFIILFVHEGDIGQPARLSHYLARRFWRVFPMYWLALGLTVLIGAAGHHPPSLGPLLWSAALLPSFASPVLGVAWTLQFEVVFYAAFAILILHRRTGLAALGVWAALVACSGFGWTIGPPQVHALYCGEFGIGMGAALVVRRGWISLPRATALAGAVLFIGAAALESGGMFNGMAGPAGRLLYGPSAALLVAGLASLEQTAKIRVPGWLQALGAASYSIYLFQFVFIAALWQGLLRAQFATSNYAVLDFVVLSAAAIAGGTGLSLAMEQPALRLSNRRVRRIVAEPAR